MSAPRAYTAEEVRDMILQHSVAMARYWASLPDVDRATGRPMTVQSRCEGVVFSMLTMLDGYTMALPGFALKLVPHEEDKAFAIEQGENWFEPGMEIEDALHEHLHRFTK